MNRLVPMLTVFVVAIGITYFTVTDDRNNQSEEPSLSHVTASGGHERMKTVLQAVAQRTYSTGMWLGDSRAKELRKKLKELPEDHTPQEQGQLLRLLAQRELMLGNILQAITHYSKMWEIAHNTKGVGNGLKAEIAFNMGVAQLRYGEDKNCCSRQHPDNCLVPIEGGGLHSDPTGSTGAIHFFTQCIEMSHEAENHNFAARWLLNLAYMTLGRYPQDVPPKYLIPPKAFRSPVQFPRFKNIAAKLGIDTFSLSGGAIADDFDNDGDLDLVTSAWDPQAQMRFFRNTGNGSFEDATQEAGLEGLLGGLNMVQADYDNDGHLDLLVLRGGWMTDDAKHPNSLLRNTGNGTFVDMTFEAGLGNTHFPTQTASFADYDNDGDLDVYIGNETSRYNTAPSQLFQNNGNGTFTDVAKAAGVTNDAMAKGVIWGDYNNDGWPDLYVSNFGDDNRLYHNKGDGTFEDVASQLRLTKPELGFPAWFFDYDNDGDLDLFVAAYSGKIWDTAQYHLDTPFKGETARMYKNNGAKGFRNVADELGIREPHAVMGANFGDLNNDGWLDFYLGTGYPDYSELTPNSMYLNQNGMRYANVTYAGGFGHLQKGHGVAFADFDNDGDQDVFQQMGGGFRGDKSYDSLYENPGFGNHWVVIQLVGRRSNRSAIGARIKIDLAEGKTKRTLYRHVNSGGSFGGNPLRQSIGLGKTASISRLEVHWPTTNTTQVFTDVPSSTFIRITEGQKAYEKLPMKSVPFKQ